MSGTVKFNVGGQIYEMLEQTARAKPDTLLCTLLDDTAREDEASTPIFVEADPARFRYIMDWYRYGSMSLSRDISVEEMRRDCAFYQLPDGVPIKPHRMSMGDVATVVGDRTSEAYRKVDELKAEVEAARQRHFAAAIHANLLEKMSSSSKRLVVDDAFRQKYDGMSVDDGTLVKKYLEDLAREEQFEVEVGPQYVTYEVM
mmetsp:Transcript_21036/g.48291  ORF Transcript_21036/g.48291 Transcript_21036/m.48291 type:complete len:201 (+) Transcript_21036:33-635(+)